jgi:DNA polymerase epsilon subunit 3
VGCEPPSSRRLAVTPRWLSHARRDACQAAAQLFVLICSFVQDALLACSEAAKLFIHYLTSTANDACRDAKRQTLSADDVLTALDDLDFGELVEPLKAALEGEAQRPWRGPWRWHLPARLCSGRLRIVCMAGSACLQLTSRLRHPVASCRAAYRVETKEKAKKRGEASKKRKAGGAPGGGSNGGIVAGRHFHLSQSMGCMLALCVCAGVSWGLMLFNLHRR